LRQGGGRVNLPSDGQLVIESDVDDDSAVAAKGWQELSAQGCHFRQTVNKMIDMAVHQDTRLNRLGQALVIQAAADEVPQQGAEAQSFVITSQPEVRQKIHGAHINRIE
jgi:hypothetical protein